MFFISEAMAQSASGAAGGQSSLMAFLPMFIIFGLMFFLLIGPQRKQQKEHKKMLEALAKEDEIVTTGGVVGKIIKLTDNYVQLDLGDSQLIWLQKNAIATLLPKGTIKSL